MERSVALVGTTALHLGFQATVTVVVYPTLFGVSPAQWPEFHRRHSKAITPLVIALYAAVLTCASGTLILDPGLMPAVTLAATLSAVTLTMAVAGPAHRVLSRGLDRATVARLRRADLVRTGLAAVATGAALLVSH